MSDITDRKPIIRERAPGRNVDIYLAPQVDQIFAESFGRLLLGPLITKIELLRVTELRKDTVDGRPVDVDEREVFCRLAVPTSALIEACGTLIEQVGSNMPAIDAAHQQLKEAITNAIRKAAAVKT